jgi:hypothetical protein
MRLRHVDKSALADGFFSKTAPHAFKCRLISHDNSVNLYSGCQAANAFGYPAWLFATITTVLYKLPRSTRLNSPLSRSPCHDMPWTAWLWQYAPQG